MGALLSTLMSFFFSSKEYKVVMVGLDNAGKTTILYKLTLGEVVQSSATVGSNVETVKYKNIQMEAEMMTLLENEDLARTPIIVLANKQDLKDAMQVDELTIALGLHSIRNHDWHIQACCALTGEGLSEALAWIYQRTRPGGQQGAAAS
ncbi:small Arf-related GTPase [Dunaliella salina]|uniref:Small Arf-related GTPase n=1 Tax=Dunaliella salina TaxID=3046 RepID=A0ABQ7GR97_DUNSA|nr:small Arf-related GTPase [Dunaliella salina]|eukprot:KAF5837127.1 small Arf-related GTPase [Dunaliella salina]